MSLEPGQMIDGKYRIVKMIGEGGMGAVYLGENVRINRKVAIKVLHASYTGNEEVMQRFEREAQAAGRIGNDHILEVLDIGQLADGDHFIIMEFLEGEPLSGRIKDRGRLMPREATPIIRQVLEGLGAAHAAGIIHRDLKPDNIFILREKAGVPDYVKIIDFGISKFNQLAGDGMKMTRTGAVMGTPYYMSPEQASGSAEADQRSDIYSMGVILYEAITGRVPFDAGTFNQLMFKIVLSDVPPPETIVPDLDPAFSSIISKAMTRDLTQRFQSTTDFIQALDSWMRSGTAVTVPPVADAAAAGLALAGGAAGRGAAADSRPNTNPGGTGPGTSGNWASSQPNVEPSGRPKKLNAGLAAALALMGLVVMGGAAFGAYSLLGKKAEPEPSASSSASSQPSVSAAAPTSAPAEAAPKVEIAATPPAAALAPPPAVASAPPSPLPTSAAKAALVASRPAAAAKPAARPATAAKPAAVARKPPVPTKPGAGTPDFGY